MSVLPTQRNTSELSAVLGVSDRQCVNTSAHIHCVQHAVCIQSAKEQVKKMFHKNRCEKGPVVCGLNEMFS